MKIILTILSKADAAAIPALVAQLKNNKAEGIWIIHNPDLGIEGNDAAAAYDAQIARFNADITNAVQRQDFNAAAELKTKRDAQAVERDLAIRQGWTKVDAALRRQTYDKMLSGFDATTADNVMVTCLQEVVLPEMAFDALLKLRGAWPAPLEHGTYVAGGPRAFLNGAVATHAQPEVKEPPVPVSAPARVAPAKDPLPKVKEGVPSISRSKFAVLSKSEAISLARELGGVASEQSTLAKLKAFIESKGVVKPAQPSPFTKKA